jgi:hypothetical protein
VRVQRGRGRGGGDEKTRRDKDEARMQKMRHPGDEVRGGI